MQWPSRAEYTEAVRDYPHVSLQDPELTGGEPRRGRDNFVVSDTGAFSIVFPIDTVSKTFALRCWVKDVSNAKDQYKKISAYLEQVRLPYFVDFEYVPQGILVKGPVYPITRMEWIDGVSLREFIEQNLQNPHIFKVVATEFQKMVAILHQHQISHGDLQDGNILIRQNRANVELKLIDYDSLFVPALRGQPEEIVGLPEYQHPQRIASGGKAREKVDYFSELVIYLSFLGLSERPDLWTQFGNEKRVNRGLLFSKSDFENPDRSNIFQELANLSPDVQRLAATLKDFCAKTSIDQLAPLEAILPKPDANTYNNRGEGLLNAGRYNEALAEFRKAIALDPNYEKARYGIGRVYLHSKRYADAINTFEQLIKDEPNYKEAHHGLGLAYFKSGSNIRATVAANAALSVDPSYQPARELLDAIRSAMPPPVPPTPGPVSPSPGPKPSPPDPKPNPVADLWQYITDIFKNLWQYTTNTLQGSWHLVTTIIFGLALVVCLIVLLIQMDAKNPDLKNQLAGKDVEIRQKELEIQGLTSSIQILKSANQKLNRDNSELQTKLENRISAINTTSGDVASLRKQLRKKEEVNQELQTQLSKKNTEIQQLQNDKAIALNENQELKKQLVGSDQGPANQTATIQRLQREKTETLTKNRRLQAQLAEKTSEAKKLTDRVQQLETEKIEIQRQNQKLQSENEVLARQNRSSRDKNTALRDQQNKANQMDTNTVVGPEPPKKIQNVTSGAASHNNQGVIVASNRTDYDKAIAHFKTAIKMDSQLAIAHYNLGCIYLEVKEYSKAISAFSEAVTVNRQFKEAHYNLGFVHLRRGAREAALNSTELALSIDPNYQLAQGLLTVIGNVEQ